MPTSPFYSQVSLSWVLSQNRWHVLKMLEVPISSTEDNGSSDRKTFLFLVTSVTQTCLLLWMFTLEFSSLLLDVVFHLQSLSSVKELWRPLWPLGNFNEPVGFFFFFASPDLRVNTILSLNSARNPFHFMAWFFFWCGLSAATRYEWSMWPWHRASPIKEAATRGPQCRIDRVSMFYWLEAFCINILGG